MKKTYESAFKAAFLIGIMLFSVLLSSLNVSADLLTDLRLYYTMNETSGTTAYDMAGSYNGNIGTNVNINKPGWLNNSFQFTAVSNSTVTTGKVPVNYTNTTYNFWMYAAASDNGGTFVFCKFTGSTYEDCLYYSSPAQLCLFPSNNCWQKGMLPNNNTWTMVTIRKQGTNYELFLNGTAFGNNTHTMGASQTDFTFGNQKMGGTFPYNGYLDSFGIWNRSLTNTEIINLWNNSEGISYPFGLIVGTSPPNWVSPTPSSGVANNTQVTLNASCSPGHTVYIWFDGNPNPTTLVLNNASVGNYTTSVITSQLYYYKAACSNAGLFSSNTTARNWTYDLTFPTITINPTNEFNMANYSVKDQYDNKLELNMTFADNNRLFAYEINITKGGVIYYNETNISISGITYVYNKTINIANWPEGEYKIDVFVSDSHTDKNIPDYEITKQKSKIKFKTQNNNNIYIESNDQSDLTAIKEKDRYTIGFVFNDGLTKDRTFHVKSDQCPLYYVQDSKYKGHFVSYCGRSGNWIDFEGVSGMPMINKIDNKHWTVYFSNLPPSVTFRSIGGLNVYNANFTWYRGNISYNNNFGLAADNTVLWINATRNSTISDIKAQLYYNGTLTTPTIQTNYTYSVYNNNSFTSPNFTIVMNFTWNITIIQGDGSNYTFNVSDSQQIYSFGINNCTGTTTRTLNIYYYNESNPTIPLNASLDLMLTVWSMTRSSSLDYSVSFPNALNHTLCILPPSATLYADMQLKYTVVGGFTENYYFVNATFSNQTQTLNLYNFNTTSGISGLQLTLRNVSNYNYYKNVVTTLQRLYVGEGVWRNVQMDESGDFGGIYFNIIERTVDYRLIFLDRNSNSILKITQPIKFVCTSGLCSLTYLLSTNATSAVSSSLVYNLSYNNNTNYINFSWSDGSGTSQDIRFYVWRNTITGLSTICDTNQTGNAGTAACNTTAHSGPAFVSIRQNNNLIYGEWTDLNTSKLYNLIPQAEAVFWTLAIMTIVIGFGLLSPVASIITGIIGLISIYIFGLLNPLTMTALIIAIVIGVIIGLKIRQ